MHGQQTQSPSTRRHRTLDEPRMGRFQREPQYGPPPHSAENERRHPSPYHGCLLRPNLVRRTHPAGERIGAPPARFTQPQTVARSCPERRGMPRRIGARHGRTSSGTEPECAAPPRRTAPHRAAPHRAAPQPNRIAAEPHSDTNASFTPRRKTPRRDNTTPCRRHTAITSLRDPAGRCSAPRSLARQRPDRIQNGTEAARHHRTPTVLDEWGPCGRGSVLVAAQ